MGRAFDADLAPEGSDWFDIDLHFARITHGRGLV